VIVAGELLEEIANGDARLGLGLFALARFHGANV
jgi:hypothetical protein